MCASPNQEGCAGDHAALAAPLTDDLGAAEDAFTVSLSFVLPCRLHVNFANKFEAQRALLRNGMQACARARCRGTVNCVHAVAAGAPSTLVMRLDAAGCLAKCRPSLHGQLLTHLSGV